MADPILENFVNQRAAPLSKPIAKSSDVWGAAFEDSNTIGSALYSKTIRESILPTDPTPVTDKEIEDVIMARNLAPYATRFLDVKTRGQLESVASDVARELDNEEILSNAGWQGFGASMVAGLLDLPTVLPFGTAVRLGTRGSIAAAKIGADASRVTWRGAASRLVPTALLDAATTEVLLHATQQTRTTEESLVNIGGSVLLTTALGASIAKTIDYARFRREGQQLKSTLKQIEDGTADIRSEEAVNDLALQIASDSGRMKPGQAKTGGLKRLLDQAKESGESRVGDEGEITNPNGDRFGSTDSFGYRTTRDSEAESSSRSAGGEKDPVGFPKRRPGEGMQAEEVLSGSQLALAKSLGITTVSRNAAKLFGGNITLDLMVSRSFTARKFISGLDSIGLEFKGTLYDGVAAPTPSVAMMARLEGLLSNTQKDLLTNYRAWRQGPDIPGGQMRSFNRQVSRALANGTEHSDPHVAAAAQAVRRLFDEVYEENVRSGLTLRRKDGSQKPVRGGGVIDDRMPIGDDGTPPGGSDGGSGARSDGPSGDGGDGPRLTDQTDQRNKFDPKDPRRDSPEYVDVATFERMVRKGSLKAPRNPANAKDVPPRIAEVGTGKYNYLEFIDQQIALGRKPNDVARQVAHEWAMKNDPEYKRRYQIHASHNGPRPNLSKESIEKAYNAIVEQRVRLATSDDLLNENPIALRVGDDDLKDVSIPERPKVDPGTEGLDKDSYFKHIWRSDHLIREADEQEFIQLEARAYFDKWRDPITGERAADLPEAAQRVVGQRALNHALGAFNAITQKHDTVGKKFSQSEQKSNRRGSILERNILIPTRDLIDKDWIETDVQLVMSQLLQQNGMDAILARRFRRPLNENEMRAATKRSPDAYWLDGDDPTTVPDLTLTQVRAEIAKEFDDEIGATLDDAVRKKLQRERDDTLEKVEYAIDLVRGQSRSLNDFIGQRAERDLAAIRDFNFARMMGNIVLSSQPDTGMVMLQHGFTPIVSTLARRSVSRVKALMDTAKAEDLNRFKRWARATAADTELTSLQRAATMADISDPFSGFDSNSTAFQRFARNAAFYGSRVTGAAYWNSGVKQLNFVIYADRMAQIALGNPDFKTKKDLRWAKSLGATNKFLKQFGAFLQEKGIESGEDLTARWTPDDMPRELFEQFSAMAQLSSRKSVLSPNKIEKPNWSHGGVGSTILQFAGHAFVSTNRVLGTAAQRAIADGGTGEEARSIYLAMASLMSLAVFSTVMRYAAADRLDMLPDPDENPGWWIYEAADRSGILGIMGHINNLWEAVKIGNNEPLPGARRALGAILGDEDNNIGSTAKSLPRDPIQVLGGPTASTINSALNVGQDILTQPFSERGSIDQNTIKDMRRLTPLIDTFYLRQITRGMEGYIVEETLNERYKK